MSGRDGGDGAPHNPLALVTTVVYGLFVVAAVLWLWLRDRQQVLAERALGDLGSFTAVWSLLIGVGVGLCCSLLIWLASRYLRAFRRLEERLEATVGELTEVEIVAVALSSAIGEELLFRGALQDHAGPWTSAVVFGLLHTGPGLLLWGAMAAVLGLCFAMMVHHGCGLLSVTVAHALINFLSLRRMMSR